MNKKEITDKEWLDLAWKHFQQHAQQRILYLNYFVVFSTILSTGLISTFQNNFQMPILGIGIGFIQIFLSYIFFKIDERNKFLTKHSERKLVSIEKLYQDKYESHFDLFSSEISETEKIKELDKEKFVLNRQLSHGKAYKIIFKIFTVIGVVGVVISSYNLIKTNNSEKKWAIRFEQQLNIIDSIKLVNSNQIITINKLQKKLEQIDSIDMKIELLSIEIKKQRGKTKTNTGSTNN